MKYTSIAKVFTYLPKNFAEEDGYALEYAAQAMDALNIHQVYDKKTCLLEVSDHQTSLPSDLKHIGALTYMHSQPTEADTDQVITTYSRSTVDDGDTVTTTFTTQRTEPDLGTVNQDHILRIQYQGVLNNYQIWSESDAFRRNFVLLRLVNKSNAINMHCTDCPNLHCDYKDYYQVNMNGQIITSIKDGYVCLFYLAKKRNDRGEFLIPDDFDVLNAIAAYIKYKYMENMVFTRQKGYQTAYQNMLREWEILSNKVKGKYILKEATMPVVNTWGNYLSHVFHNSNAFDNFSY